MVPAGKASKNQKPKNQRLAVAPEPRTNPSHLMDMTALRSGALHVAADAARPDRLVLETCPFRVADVPADRLAGGLDAHVLACLRYGREAAPIADPRCVPILLDRIDEAGVAELWISDEPVQIGESDGIRYAANRAVLFGWLHLPENELAEMERSVLRAYVRLDQFINERGYPCWLRAWNYLAHINQGNGDDERYRRFSLGRYNATALKPGFEGKLPAATAIGTHGEGLTICFMVGKHPAVQVENPRQVSAFRYPRQYGPRSPSFSRAVLQHWRDSSVLFVSGTASVVGHDTLHPGDAARQLEETLANVEALLANAAQLGDLPLSGFVPEAFKLYVRRPEYFAEVEATVRQRLMKQGPVAVLQGDICRNDLALEVEAVYRWRGEDLRRREPAP